MTHSRLNEGVLDEISTPFKKNIKNQNPVELLFKDVKHFDAQNSVIGSLIREVDIGKKKDFSKFLDQAPDVRDLEIRENLNKLENNEFFNRANDFAKIPLAPNLSDFFLDNNNNNNNNNNNDNNNIVNNFSSPIFSFVA